MDEPELGWTTQAEVVDVYDGDTITVEIKRRFQVRLQHPNKEGLIFDTPELKTEYGPKARQAVRDFIKNGDMITLTIPSNKPLELFDETTFNRVVGYAWSKGKSITGRLLELGLGRLIKQNKRTTTPWPWEKTDVKKGN